MAAQQPNEAPFFGSSVEEEEEEEEEEPIAQEAPAQERSNPLLGRIMATQREDVPVFSSSVEEEEEEEHSAQEAPAQERSNPLLGRIMAAQREEVPVFSSSVDEEEEEHSAEETSRDSSGLHASQFTSTQADERSETEPSHDPSGLGQVNSTVPKKIQVVKLAPHPPAVSPLQLQRKAVCQEASLELMDESKGRRQERAQKEARSLSVESS